jgi:hypothetical protein
LLVRLFRLAGIAVLVTLLGVGALGACTSTPRQAQGDMPEETYVTVDNRSMLDMTIYVIRGSERRRLGLVNALSTQTLRIPRVLVQGVGVLRFLADPVGATRTPTSEEISVRHGDVVKLTIPPQ